MADGTYEVILADKAIQLSAIADANPTVHDELYAVAAELDALAAHIVAAAIQNS